MPYETLKPTSSRPVRPQPSADAPESAGPLFSEKADLSTDDPRILGAQEMLASLGSPGSFRVHPSLRTEQARPHGAYPGEGPAVPVNELLEKFKTSLLVAQTGMLKHDMAASLTGLEGALDAIHGIGRKGETDAPLHAWLPEGSDVEVLSRLTFAHAELTNDQESQRRQLHHLDLLLDALPNPLEGDETTARQRLLRMFTHIYMGRALDRSRTVQEAIKQYEIALEINDIHTPGIEEARLIAYAELINLHFKRAWKLSSEKKTDRFMKHINAIVGLREAIEAKLSPKTEEMRNALIILRQDLARRFFHLGLVESAYKELHGIQDIYGSSRGVEIFSKFVANSNLSESEKAKVLSRFTSGDKLIAPDDLKPLPLHSRAWLFISKTLKNAHRPKTLETVKGWAGGAAVAAGAAYAFTGGDATVAEMLMASGSGAAVLDVAMRTAIGMDSPRTKESAGIGFNDVPATQGFRMAAGFAANTLLPYALMGGQIPGLGGLDQVPALGGLIEPAMDSAIAAGSIYGPGALVSGGIDTVFGEAQAMSSALNAGGTDALANYANHLGSTTVGSSVSAAYSTYSSAVGSVLDGTLLTRIGSATQSAIHADAANIAFNGYKASSLGYYLLSRFSPKFREKMGWIGPAFVPGGLALAADLGDALGAFPGYVNVGPFQVPLNLVGTAAVGGGYQILGQTLIGNRGFKEIQWFNVIGSALVINSYVGASSNFNPAVQSETIGQMVGESIGRQIGMLPIIALHGAMLMVDARRFAENKLARILFYDHFSNVTRIAIGNLKSAGFIGAGGWSGFVPVLSGVSIGFLFTNSMLGRTFNDLAGSKPAALSFAKMLQNAGGVASDGELHALGRSLRRLPPAPQLTKMSSETLTLPLRAFYHSLVGKKLAQYMLPEEKSYRMIHEGLMAKPERGGWNETQVETLLSATEAFLNRPDDADMARGLAFVLSTAKEGPHGERIQSFLNQRREIHSLLRVDRNTEPLPESKAEQEQRIWEALRYPYRVCPEKHIDDMAGAVDGYSDEAVLASQYSTAGLVGAGLIANASLIPYIPPTVF